MGAYLQAVTPGVPLLGAWLYGGCYDLVAYDFHCTGVFTTTTPTDAYRGAGRPEATYAIERAIDALAPQGRQGPVEIRRLNFITEFPADARVGSRDRLGRLRRVPGQGARDPRLRAVRAEQAARREQGATQQLGVGFSTYVEMCGLAPSRILGALNFAGGGWEAMTVRCLPTGTVQVVSGTSPHGQGHATTFSQIVADRLGVDVDAVEFLYGDTAVSPHGPRHVRQPRASRSAASRSGTQPRRSSPRPGESPRTPSRWRRTTSSTSAGGSPSGGRTRA